MVLVRLPTLVGRLLIGIVFGTAFIYASVWTTLTLSARACDATCESLLQQRTVFENQAVAELQRCERATQSPCAPMDTGVAYQGAIDRNERLVAYRRAHKDEAAAISDLARQKKANIPPR